MAQSLQWIDSHRGHLGSIGQLQEAKLEATTHLGGTTLRPCCLDIGMVMVSSEPARDLLPVTVMPGKAMTKALLLIPHG